MIQAIQTYLPYRGAYFPPNIWLNDPGWGNRKNMHSLPSTISGPISKKRNSIGNHIFEILFLFHLPSSTDQSLDCTFASWQLGFPVFQCGRWFTPLPPILPGLMSAIITFPGWYMLLPEYMLFLPKYIFFVQFTSVFWHSWGNTILRKKAGKLASVMQRNDEWILEIKMVTPAC